MILVTILSICSIGCKTASDKGVYVPKLDTSVEKPVLEPIPSLNSINIPEDDRKCLETVISTYNRNLLKLVTYSRQLEEMNAMIEEYYLDAIKATD